MKLREFEKLFCAAFATTARRDPYLAAIHAGVRMTREDAKQLLARPAIREELERLSMRAEIVDGEVMDVEPVPITEQHGPVKGLKAARAALVAERLARLGATPQKPAQAIVEPLTTTRTVHQRVKAQLASLGMPDEPAPVSPRAARGALRAVEVLTATGEVAGTLRETVSRLERAQRGKHKGSSARRPDPSPKDPAALAQRLDDLQDPNTAHEQADGTLMVTMDKVATRYEIKKWLTAVMLGKLTGDVGVRMQAAALLGKSLGMFDAKQIEREREIDDLVPESEDEIRAQIEKTQLELVRLES